MCSRAGRGGAGLCGAWRLLGSRFLRRGTRVVRDRVDASSGLVLRRWTAGDAGAVMTAFADPLMRGQSAEPVDSVGTAEPWTAARGDQWAAGSAYSFAVVDGGGLVLGQGVCRAGGPAPWHGMGVLLDGVHGSRQRCGFPRLLCRGPLGLRRCRTLPAGARAPGEQSRLVRSGSRGRLCGGGAATAEARVRRGSLRCGTPCPAGDGCGAGHGHGAVAVVRPRPSSAAARQVPYLYGDASADSAPILVRLGLHAVTTTTRYVWSP